MADLNPDILVSAAASSDAFLGIFDVNDSTFWAAAAGVAFILLLFYLKAPQSMVKGLETKRQEIAKELDDAKRLREEAQALLAEYERKRKDAEAEAADIVEAAKKDAHRLTEEANDTVKALIERRTAAVENKIAQAEARALAQVRSQSADLAVEAAKNVLKNISSKQKSSLVDQAIEDVAKQLN